MGSHAKHDNVRYFQHVTALLHITTPHFSDRSSPNYEILSEMFSKTLLHRVLGYAGFLHLSFPRHSEGQLLFLFLSQAMIM